jgi:hypothetical protein
MRFYVLIAALTIVPISNAEPVRLIEKAPVGGKYRIVADSTIAGELQAPVAKDKPAETIKVSGKSRIDYVERVLAVDPKDADRKALRIYDRMDFKKTTADRTDESTLRPGIRRLVLMKKGHSKVPFSPDGPLMWSEIDLLRTDIMVAALTGLLPEREVEPGDTWKANVSAATELTDLEKIDQGELICTLDKVVVNGPRTIAYVSFAGTLTGVNEDGPTRQKLSGRMQVDVKAKCITYLKVDGEHFLLDGKGKQVGMVAGSFELNRKPLAEHKELSDAVVGGLELDPNETNTRLLFDNPELGVRFTHARNWRVVRNTGRQITLDESGGAGLLITLDTTEAAPTAARYLREAMKELNERGGKLTNRTGPENLADGIDRFVLDAELGKESVTMEYFVILQSKGGATLAARIPLADREARMKELERLARSFTITRRLDGK